MRFDYSACASAPATLSAPSPAVYGINRWSYDKDTSNCQIEFNVPSDIPGPVYIYYRLTSFYQNNRMYVKSFDLKQLGGAALTRTELKDQGGCVDLSHPQTDPILNNLLFNGTKVTAAENSVYYPCGLIANSIFTGMLFHIDDLIF